ncbi:MAG: hypothetical protein IBJ00_02145 [Alphaproteobacteria bacterium]|nr:hypothetical protein [Alphaproteobacteria bacterium]
MQFFKKVKRVLKEKRIEIYSKAVNLPFVYAPYELKLYEEYLSRLKHDTRINFISFNDCIDNTKINFVFRHDLDTLDCLKNSGKLIDLHIKHMIPLTIFVRMDDIDYSSKASYKYLSKYVESWPIGLHSSCYIDNNPIDAFKIEIEKFEAIYKFIPKFLTLHGLGSYKYDARMEFIKFISEFYQRYNLEFADFISKMRTYNYVVQDCHLMEGKRYLKHDILELPPKHAGSCYLFLAHPCYWR